MGVSTFSGPLKVGDVKEGASINQGTVVLYQAGTITQNSTNAVSVTFTLPQNASILDFVIDVTTAFDSATSATLTIGTAAAGTQYVSGVNAKTGGRAAPTLSTTQLTNMSNIGTNTSVVATVTPSGATAAGTVLVGVRYIQN